VPGTGYDARCMRILLVVAALAGLTVASSVYAQPATPVSADTRAAFDAAFQETLRKPSDPTTLIRYAELAVKVGDLEAAVTALERMLLIEGDQPRVRLELGLLYFRLRSYEVARAYLDGARTSGRATPEIKERATQAIAEVDRLHGPSRLSGDLFLGLRYSSNANSGPSGAIRAFGAPFVPNPTISRRADFSAVAAANVRHRYDLGRQDSGTLETDLGLYSARQFQVHEANVHVVDLTAGPRMSPFEGDLSGLQLKPFLNARWVSVHDYTTYWAWGAGVEASMPFSERFRSTFTLLGRHREFINNPDAPTNDRSSGNEVASYLDFRIVLAPWLLLTAGGNVGRYTAATASESFWEYGFSASLSARFTDPLGINGLAWVLTASSGVQFADFDQPNLAVDPFIARRQTDFSIGLILAVPLDDRFTLITQAGYVQRASPLANYAYDSFSTMVGVGWRF
jgi:hypothetical protein